MPLGLHVPTALRSTSRTGHNRRALGDVDWEQLLADAAGGDPPEVIVADTYLRKWGTSSQPVLLTCPGHGDFVVKGPVAGRAAVNDQIVGRLAEIANCPTGRPALVEVTQTLIDNEPEMAHFTAGVWHGSGFLVGYSESQGNSFQMTAENRPRFASLAILFGWMVPNDPQFIYANTAGQEVASVDHGHFFAGGPNWTIGSLAAAPPAAPDPGVIAGAGLTPNEVEAARVAFAAASNAQIALAVATPPDHWGLTHDERLAMARHLADRRDILFA